MSVAAGVTRGALVAELAAVVGAPHEARFIVDEALGLGLALGHPDPPTGALDDDVVAAARCDGRPAGGGGAAAIRLRSLALPLARPGWSTRGC